MSEHIILQIVMTPADLAELEWQDQSLCAQTDPELFFVEKGGSTRPAKAICRACPVRVDCLRYALEHGEVFGVWGSLSPEERAPARADYLLGVSVEDIIAAADADWDARTAAEAQRSSELSRKNTETFRAERRATAQARGIAA